MVKAPFGIATWKVRWPLCWQSFRFTYWNVMEGNIMHVAVIQKICLFPAHPMAPKSTVVTRKASKGQVISNHGSTCHTRTTFQVCFCTTATLDAYYFKANMVLASCLTSVLRSHVLIVCWSSQDISLLHCTNNVPPKENEIYLTYKATNTGCAFIRTLPSSQA